MKYVFSTRAARAKTRAKAKTEFEYSLNVFKLQVLHHEENGFTVPLELNAEYIISKCETELQDYSYIRRNIPAKLNERRLRRIMIEAFGEIFTEDAKELEKKTASLIEDWNEKFNEKHKGQDPIIIINEDNI